MLLAACVSVRAESRSVVDWLLIPAAVSWSNPNIAISNPPSPLFLHKLKRGFKASQPQLACLLLHPRPLSRRLYHPGIRNPQWAELDSFLDRHEPSTALSLWTHQQDVWAPIPFLRRSGSDVLS